MFRQDNPLLTPVLKEDGVHYPKGTYFIWDQKRKHKLDPSQLRSHLVMQEFIMKINGEVQLHYKYEYNMVVDGKRIMEWHDIRTPRWFMWYRLNKYALIKRLKLKIKNDKAMKALDWLLDRPWRMIVALILFLVGLGLLIFL